MKKELILENDHSFGKIEDIMKTIHYDKNM